MADASVTLEMLIKEGKAIIGLERVAAAQQKVEKGAGKIGSEAKRADAELERFAKRTTQLNATPLEKYNTQMSKLEAALERGKIKHDIYTRAVYRAKEAYDQVGRAQQAALGPSFLGQIEQFAAGYITLSSAVQLVGDAFRHAKEESQAALNSMKGLDDTRQGLAQLAIGKSPGTLAQWQNRADAAAMGSGASRDVAYKALHTMETYGQLDKYEEVMGAHPLVNAGAGAVIATKVREMTGKEQEFRPLLNMLIEAGKHSAVDAENLVGPMAIAMEGGRDIGAGAAETAALLAVLTTDFAGRGEDGGEGKAGAARIAGDRIKTFAHKVGTRLPALAESKPGWTGSFEAVDKMPAADKKEFFQENQELRSAFTAYTKNRDKVKAVYRATDAAGAAPRERDNLTEGLLIRGADPKSRAVLKNTRAGLKQEVATENNLGISFANADSARAEAEAASNRAGLNFWQRWGVAGAARTAAFMGASPSTTLSAGKWGGNLATVMGGGIYGGGGIENFIGEMKKMESQQASTEKQEQAADALIRAAEALSAAASNFGGRPTRAIQDDALAPQN